MPRLTIVADRINNSYDTTTWERLTAVKSRILRLWNTAPPSIRICCIKFAQRVVLAQTVAGEQDLRVGYVQCLATMNEADRPHLQRGDVLRVHAGMVPPNHPLLEPQTLEAEATGLLDRMLGVLQENSVDALLVDATLNCLSILLRSRPTTYNRILNAVLNFNPLKLANSPATPKNRVFIRSMEKTTRSLLGHLAKRDPHNPNTVRIHQHLERLNRSRIEIFDEAGRKRPYAEQGDALDTAKRQKMLPGPAAAVPELHITPLKPGPHSLADVFTFVTNSTIKSFDVTVVPADMVAKISVVSLVQVDPSLLARAVQGVRDRLASFKEVQPSMLNPDTAPLGVEEDDEDEYDPDDYAAEDTEQILNKLDGASPDDRVQKMEAAALALGSFALPSPSPITPELTLKAGQGTLQRVFDMTKTLDEPAPKKSKAGLNRLASSSFDRDSWITLITRLATRASSGLEDIEVKDEADNKSLTKSLASVTRESLYTYVLEDFRKRIDIAVSWLSEEWYNDQLEKQRGSHAPLHYNTWALKVIDGLLPYLTPQDKVLTRFLSELPELNAVMLARVKSLCRDPSMVQLALTSLLYLVMMRPPIREVALDTVQDIWTECK